MRKLWRIVARRHEASAFSGEGARRFGGRWNHAGHAVVYTSENLSLAALELFVHVDPGLVTVPRSFFFAELPPDLKVRSITTAELPSNWREYPSSDALRNLGTNWLRSGESVALEVPSAIVPQERNILLAPNHPDFPQIKIAPPEPFVFDPRMVKDDG